MRNKLASSLMISILMLGIILSGCNKTKKPAKLIPHKKYVKLIVEFELLKVYQTTYQDSASSAKLRQKVLKHYDVTMKQFEQSRNYYITTGREHSFLKEALDTLNVVRDKLWNIKYKKPAKRDSVRKLPPKK